MARDILIVDDEADIRDLIAGLLEDDGYQAREAGDAVRTLAPEALPIPVRLRGALLALATTRDVSDFTPHFAPTWRDTFS